MCALFSTPHPALRTPHSALRTPRPAPRANPARCALRAPMFRQSLQVAAAAERKLSACALHWAATEARWAAGTEGQEVRSSR